MLIGKSIIYKTNILRYFINSFFSFYFCYFSFLRFYTIKSKNFSDVILEILIPFLDYILCYAFLHVACVTGLLRSSQSLFPPIFNYKSFIMNSFNTHFFLTHHYYPYILQKRKNHNNSIQTKENSFKKINYS